MLLSAVSVLVVAQSSSEIPEGLTNNPVLYQYLYVERRIREDLWNLLIFNVLFKVAVSTVPMFCILFVVKFLMIYKGPKF